MANEIKPGQVWQSRRKGEEHRRVEVTLIPQRTDDPRAYVRVTRLNSLAGTDYGFGVCLEPRAGELTTRTLRKNYRLVKETP